MNRILQGYIENPGELQKLRMRSIFEINMEEAMKGLSRVEEKNSIRGRRFWFTTDNGIQFSAMKDRTDNIVLRRKN
uniref:HTH_48 domain-containing protein n=1 Tax=Caenorhabditis tropicalis TaxID=1561998 RepID=A0A1I7UT78_9PELO